MRVRIIESGESLDEKLDETVVETFNPRNEESAIHRKSLRSVFNHMAQSAGSQISLRRPKGIYPETIRFTTSYLIAKMPGLYADHIGGWPGSSHRFLVDENLPKDMGSHLWQAFGRATHTYYEGLNGEKDDKVWRWAVQSRVSAIITRDRRMTDNGDLGLIAVRHAYDLLRKRKNVSFPVEMPNLPLIIQIDSKSKRSVLSLLKEHKEEIMEHLQYRTSPYVFLTDTHCVKGPSYDDIAKYDWATIKHMAADIIAKTKMKNGPQNGPSFSPS